jgi:predicted transcriptional regulator
LYDKARAGLAQGDAGNWGAAEAMAQLAEAGESQVKIAAALKVSRGTVQNYLKVWGCYVRSTPRPSFSEALGQIRDYSKEWEDRKDPIPKTQERRAELAVELIKDKAIFEEPAVRKEVRRHVDREIRQAAKEWNREHGIPTRTEKTRDGRRLSPVINRIFWRDLLWALEKAAKLLGEAVGELERTGLPEEHAGAVIKAARSLSGAADRFSAAATDRAVGSSMN